MSAILESQPARILEPQSVAELADIVRETASEELALAAIGSGTQLDLGNPPARYDVAIRMGGLRRIVEYAPEDQIVVVEAGITVGALQAELAPNGQRLAVDPPDGERMSIGGMLATNAYGPSASRYGMLKDLIVGIEIVRADGAIAHAGGKVVKNVAGFDLSKLMVGSLGTLAIVTSAAFRLHPLPEFVTVITMRMRAADLFPFTLALRDEQLEPASVVANLDGSQVFVSVTFEGFSAGVQAQVEACNACARSFEGAAFVNGLEPPRWDTATVYFRSTFPPSATGDVAARLDAPGVRAQLWPLCGTAIAAADEPFNESAILALRSFFEGLGGTLVVTRMPAPWRARVDAWGTPPPSFALMRNLKARFDPDNRLNPGRFVGGL